MNTIITNHAGLPRLRHFAKKASGSKSSRAGIALPLLIGILAVAPTRQAEAQTGGSWTDVGQVNETISSTFLLSPNGVRLGASAFRHSDYAQFHIAFRSVGDMFYLSRVSISSFVRPGDDRYSCNDFDSGVRYGLLQRAWWDDWATCSWAVGGGLPLIGSDPLAVQAEFMRICQTFKHVIGDVDGRSLGFVLTGADGTPWILEPGSTLTVTMDDGNCVFDSTDTTPPSIDDCPADRVGPLALPYDFYMYPESGVAVPADATAFSGAFWAGSVSDNVTEPGNLMMGVSDSIVEGSSCPVVIHRTYVFTDEAGNTSEPCVQTIHVNNLFAPDAIIWHRPLARKGMSEDTEPSLGGPKKFKLGQTIPIKVHAVGCEGDITANSNVTGTVKVLGDTAAMMGSEDDVVIDYNGIGGGLAGEMVKIDGHLKYNLDTKSLMEIPDTKVYILQVTVSDSSTGESVTEEIQLEAK